MSKTKFFRCKFLRLSLVMLSVLALFLTACGDITPSPEATPLAAVTSTQSPTNAANPSPATTTNVAATPTVISTPTPTPAGNSPCLKTDLTASASLDDTELVKMNGKIAFTNQSTHSCTLQGTPEIQLLAQNRQALPLSPAVYPAQLKITPDSIQVPIGPISIHPGQTVFVTFILFYACKLFVEPKGGNMGLKVTLAGTQIEFDLAVAAISAVREFQTNSGQNCGDSLKIQISPFEWVAGRTFTAVAAIAAQTVMVEYKTKSAIQEMTIAALPPTPTATTIPPVPANAKLCDPANLKLERGGGNGWTGWELVVFYITNLGSSTCTLQGYPELRQVNEKGQPDPRFSFLKVVAVPNDKGYPYSLATNTTKNPVVAVQPGKAAVLSLIWFARCDQEKYLPGRMDIKLNLPGSAKEFEVWNSDSRHCDRDVNIQTTSFDYPPDNWRTKLNGGG